MTRSNTLVYSCECDCFVLFYCLILWMYFSMHLVLSDVYWHVPYSDAIDAGTGSVEWIYIYIYIYMEWKRKIIFLRHALWMRTFFVHDNKVLQLTIKLGRSNPRMKRNLHVDHQWVVLFRVPWRISSNKLEGWWGMLVWCPRRRWENSFWVATREIPTL
jgi:hypothetical protein